MKTCKKCGIEKDESEFAKEKRCNDGLMGHCYSCERKYRNLRYNPEKQKERYLINYSKTFERKKIYLKKWRKLNPNKSKHQTEKWREENKEKYIYSTIKTQLKKQIGETPPPELVEVKLLINKTKRLCKTLKS